MAAAVIKRARRWDVKNCDSDDPLVVVVAGVDAMVWIVVTSRERVSIFFVRESKVDWFPFMERRRSLPSFFPSLSIPPVPHFDLNLLQGWNHFQSNLNNLHKILVQMNNCYKWWELVINSQQFLTLSDSTLITWISNTKYTWVYTFPSVLLGDRAR